MYSFQLEIIRLFVEVNLKNLITEGVVKFRKINNLDVDKYEIIPFFKFLEKIGIIDEETRKNKINKFRSEKEIRETFGLNEYL